MLLLIPKKISNSFELDITLRTVELALQVLVIVTDEGENKQ